MFNNAKKVSIIVPVYNAEKYIGDCIESIIRQTYKNLEILINNDGSTDCSYEICKKYANRDCRIKLFSQENQGVSVARNAMLDVFSGDYVMFVDSDDMISPICVESLVSNLEINNAGAVVCNYTHWERLLCNNNSSKIIRISSREDVAFFSSHLFGLHCSVWCKLLRREDAKRLVFPIDRYYEDLLTIPEFMSDIGNLIYIPNKFYFYRQRIGSIMHSAFSFAKTDMLDGYIGVVKLGVRLGSMKIVRGGGIAFLVMYVVARIRAFWVGIDSSRIKEKYNPFVILFLSIFFSRDIPAELMGIEIPPPLR